MRSANNCEVHWKQLCSIQETFSGHSRRNQEIDWMEPRKKITILPPTYPSTHPTSCLNNQRLIPTRLQGFAANLDVHTSVMIWKTEGASRGFPLLVSHDFSKGHMCSSVSPSRSDALEMPTCCFPPHLEEVSNHLERVFLHSRLQLYLDIR